MKKRKRRDKYLDLAKELKKLWNIRQTMMPFVVGALGIVPKGLEKKIGGIGNQRNNRGYSETALNRIGLNTEKSPGDLKRLAVTQTRGKDHQLKLV